MPFLIDGHNLIAHLPDVELDDPHDEAKLVEKLRGFAARTRKKIFVIFDQGLPGGKSPMSNNAVHVIFASSRQTTADRIIMERIRETPDCPNWTVISSDNEVLDAAKQAGMRPLRCQLFAEILNIPIRPNVHQGLQENVMVGEQEIAEWLEVFNEKDEISEKPTPPRQRKKTNTPPRAQSKSPTKKQRSSRRRSEVDEYLKAFGAEDEIGTAQSTAQSPDIIPQRRNKSLPKQKSTQKTPKEQQTKQGDNVDEWLNAFDGERNPTDKAARIKPSAVTPADENDAPQKPTKTQAIPPSKHLTGDVVDAWMDLFEDAEERKPTDKAPRLVPRGKSRSKPKPKDETIEKDGIRSENTVDSWLEVFGDGEQPEPTDPAPQRNVPSKQGRYKSEDGKRGPTVHKRMATSDEVFLSDGEVDAWMNLFDVDEDD